MIDRLRAIRSNIRAVTPTHGVTARRGHGHKMSYPAKGSLSLEVWRVGGVTLGMQVTPLKGHCLSGHDPATGSAGRDDAIVIVVSSMGNMGKTTAEWMVRVGGSLILWRRGVEGVADNYGQTP